MDSTSRVYRAICGNGVVLDGATGYRQEEGVDYRCVDCCIKISYFFIGVPVTIQRLHSAEQNRRLICTDVEGNVLGMYGLHEKIWSSE